MGRAPCCDKANVKRGPWSPEEDAKLKAYIEKNGTGGNWIALPHKIGLKRCGKSCRLRWLNYLRPDIKHGGFTEEEDNIICGLYINIGSRWSIIAAQLPGRTDNDIKNYWNTKLKKRLFGTQRKEPPNGLKQELKRPSESTFMFPEGPLKQASYFPEFPVTLPTVNPLPQNYPSPEDQASYFSDDIKPPEVTTNTSNLHCSMDAIPNQNGVYSDSMHMISTLAYVNPIFGVQSPDMFRGVEDFPFESSEVFSGYPDQLGLESLYGVDGNTGTISAASAESISWGAEMDSLIYPFNGFRL